MKIRIPTTLVAIFSCITCMAEKEKIVDAELMAFTLNAAGTSGFTQDGPVSERFHVLEFSTISPEELKNERFVVWMYPSDSNIEDRKTWSKNIGSTFEMKIDTDLIGNEDYPCVIMCPADYLKKKSTSANQSTHTTSANARLFDYEPLKINDLRHGGQA